MSVVHLNAPANNVTAPTWFTGLAANLVAFPRAAGTMMFIGRRTATGGDCMGLLNTTGAGIQEWFHTVGFSTVTGWTMFDDDGIVGSTGPTLTAPATTDLILLAITMPATGTTQTFHYKNITTGAAAVHSAGTANGGKRGATPVANTIAFGQFGDQGGVTGDLVAAAMWDVQLTNAQVDECWANSRTSDIWNNSAGNPDFLTEGNTLSLIDLAGNATLAQIGTATLTGTDPVWNFDGTGASAPATANGQYGWGTYGEGDYGPNFGESTGVPLSGSETHTLTEQSSILVVSFSRVDSWALGDTGAASIAADLQRVDSLAVSEASAIATSLTTSDSWTLSESPGSLTIQQSVAASDSWTFTDLSTLQTIDAKAASDSSVASEASSIAADLQRVDSWAITDLAAVAADLQRVDSWAFTDAPGSLQSVNLIGANETHTQSDASALSAAIATVDNWSLTDLASIAADLSRVDSWAFTDAPGSIQSVNLVTASDSWAVSEAAASLTTTDFKTANDSLTLTDTVTGIAAAVTAADIVGLLESSAINAALATGEAFSATEISSLATLLSLSANDSATQSEQASALSATLAASDSLSITDLVLDLADTTQKVASDSFSLNESAATAQIVAITRTDAFTLSAEVAGVVVLTEAAYIHHKVPLDGIVQELPTGGTILAMVADGVVVASVTVGTVGNATATGLPSDAAASGVVLEPSDLGVEPTYTADATVD